MDETMVARRDGRWVGVKVVLMDAIQVCPMDESTAVYSAACSDMYSVALTVVIAVADLAGNLVARWADSMDVTLAVAMEIV